jgi:hypothetical protein
MGMYVTQQTVVAVYIISMSGVVTLSKLIEPSITFRAEPISRGLILRSSMS